MAKRGASSQNAFERSPKRTQLIEITSDSDSELPNISFTRLPARSQRARDSTQRKSVTARDSWLVKPVARCVDDEEDEGEAEPELGLALMDDHSDSGRQETIEPDLGEPSGFTISDVRDNSSPLIAHPSDPRSAPRTSDTRETFGDADPSDVHSRATTPVRSLSAEPTLVEDVATSLPTVGAVETYVTNPDYLHSTGNTHDNSDDIGPVRTTSVATAPQKPVDSHTITRPDEALATNCSTAHTTNPIALNVMEGAAVEPVISAQSTSDQHERLDVGLVPGVQAQDNDVEVQQHSSEQSHKVCDDMDAVTMFVERASNNMWHLFSNCSRASRRFFLGNSSKPSPISTSIDGTVAAASCFLSDESHSVTSWP